MWAFWKKRVTTITIRRGDYADNPELEQSQDSSASTGGKWAKYFGITREFTLRDKLTYWIATGYTLLLFGLFVGMNVVAFCMDVSDKGWAIFQFYRFGLTVVMTFVFSIWLGIGGIGDIIQLFKDLKTSTRDITDDGRVDNLDKR